MKTSVSRDLKGKKFPKIPGNLLGEKLRDNTVGYNFVKHLNYHQTILLDIRDRMCELDL